MASEEPPDWEELARISKAIVVKPNWRDQLIWKRTAKGNQTTLENHIVNITTILAHDERWVGAIALNEFSQDVELVKRSPTEPRDDGAWLTRPLIDTDLTEIGNWLASQHNLLVRPESIGLAAAAIARRNSYHPVRDYLDSLAWDGIERLSSWLEDYCGATSTSGATNYVRSVGRAWMISAVARIYQPGCQVDHTLILEGKTSIGKSTLFKILGGEWFTDQLGDLNSKDSHIGVHGVWIIELAELDVMARHEVSRIKAFLTIRFDRLRPPYGHIVMRYDRQCVFAGTVNHFDYLRDEAGNRRFWPVRCADNKFNLGALAESRDQLWAEAVAAYRVGEEWHLRNETSARAEQEDRMMADAWDGPVGDYLAGVSREAGPLLRERAYVTLPDVMKALQIPVERQGQAESRRVVSILKRMGWSRRQVRTDALREWRYMAPGPESVEP